ncbi:heavy-metal-associated domain-containing protein [Actinomyces polynesiensis]|uniref:heavy-metal-associated domain-containing protein n=1 Tax=Actinomyces polynesiensis TaxID=1325934 RepID=UPI0005B93B08|nr:heavy metal-associated domain-containing protein [Actinomyces polynesiensis]
MSTLHTTTTPTHTVLRAQGFSCPSCVAKIEKQLRRLPGVQGVSVHFASSRVEVDHDPARVSTQDLVDALAHAGYPSAPSDL